MYQSLVIIDGWLIQGKKQAQFSMYDYKTQAYN